MYYVIGVFICFACIFVLVNHCRANAIRKKICSLSCPEKEALLNEWIEPFGFAYSYQQDLFYSRRDAWQRDFGYCSLYDQLAPHIQLVFNCEPLYFDYEGRTWLIELWKGQYGINTGAEIGVYHADGLLSPEEYSTALFQAADDSQLLGLSMELWKEDERLFQRSQRHWWLTGFLMGCFSRPEELTLKVGITFPDCEMMDAFLQSLIDLGHAHCSYSIRCTTVYFSFCRPKTTQPCQRVPLICRFSQWKNRWLCRLFCWITRPFCCSGDRLLYLCDFLPFVFRRSLKICNPRRYGVKKKHSKKHTKKTC